MIDLRMGDRPQPPRDENRSRRRSFAGSPTTAVAEPALGVDGRHAARARRGHDLAVDAVVHVAGREHALDAGHRRARHDGEVALVVVVEEGLEQLRRRVMTDGDEDSVERLDVLGAGALVAEPHSGDTTLVHAQDLLHRERPHERDVLVRARVLDHDLRRAERLAPVYHHDLAGDLCQCHRLIHRRVAPSDDRDALALEERAVTGHAVGDAVALERRLRGQSQALGGRAGGHDHGLGLDLDAGQRQPERPGGEVDLLDVLGDQLAPKRSACLRRAVISSGPVIPSANPG